jgi:starch-binding outer membrane protein, SusD/RagB family
MNKRNWNRLLYGMAGVIVAGGVTYACKDFLDIPSQGTVEQASLVTRAGVEGSLIAAYRSLDCSSSSGAWGCAASNWAFGSVPSGDAYKGSNAGDQQPVNDIETYYWAVPGAQTYLNQKWSQVYEGVSRANATLRLLDKVVLEKPAEIDTAAAAGRAAANGIRGEALFLRAHYHFEAYRMWGRIPYYFETDTTPVAQGGFRKPNDMSQDSIVKLILADLNSAIALLDSTPRNGEVGRASGWTARAYKGRVQVYGAALIPALWDSALVTLRDVQGSGEYALETSFDRVWTGFSAYQNGPETIFAFQASANDGEPDGWNANYGERLNFPYAEPWCCGFHQPSQNLVNFFAVDSVTGLPLELTAATWNDNDSNFTPTQAIGLTPVDPRLDWTVGRDAVPFKDWGLHTPGFIRDVGYSGPYSAKKNVDEKAADAQSNVGWTAAQLNNVNIHLFRYADLLLMLAEAEVERGTLANALAIVNQIRARAGQRAQGCGSADSATLATYAGYCTAGNANLTVPLFQGVTLDSVTTPWARYRIGMYPAFPTQAYARRAIQFERRLELAMEGQRFFDLRRWGGADSVINNYVGKEKTRRSYLQSAAAFISKHALYPIPELQIQLSKVGSACRLQQNTGWGSCQ